MNSWHKTKPYEKESSQSIFYVPKTLEDDFDRFLENDIPGAVQDYQWIQDWFHQEDCPLIRGELYANSSKSRYANTDNALNFRTNRRNAIRKGDMLVNPFGVIYVLDWTVTPESNNMPSRALLCNTTLSFLRFRNERTDERGYLIDPEGWDVIVPPIPVNIYRYEGRPEFVATDGQAGINPNALTMLTLQYNDVTKVLRVGDMFDYAHARYEVIDVDYAGVDNYKSGTILLQSKKTAGGAL